MPILLESSHRGYGEVKIVEIRLRIERRNLFLLFQYGDTVDGVWVAGDLQSEEKLVTNVEQVLDGEGGEVRAAVPAYDLLVATSQALASDEAIPGDGGYNCYVGTARSLYQHAIDSGWFTGSIQ